jgi:hypothetical protein
LNSITDKVFLFDSNTQQALQASEHQSFHKVKFGFISLSDDLTSYIPFHIVEIRTKQRNINEIQLVQIKSKVID